MSCRAREYYRSLCESEETRIRSLSSRIRFWGWLRLLLVLAAIGIWFALSSVTLCIAMTAICIVGFFVAVKIHSGQFDQRAAAVLKRDFCKSQLRVADLDLSRRPRGTRYEDKDHPFVSDLDVFGKDSLFSLLDSTVTSGGMDLLAEWLLNPLLVADRIVDRQCAVEELSRKVDFRVRLSVAGAMRRAGEEESVVSGPPPEISLNLFQKIYVYLCPVVFALVLVLSLCGVISGMWILYGGIFSLCLVSITGRTASRLHSWLSSGGDRLTSSAGMVREIENEDFESADLTGVRDSLCAGGKVSASISRLERYCHNLDQRYNIIGFALLNAFFAWDWRQRLNISRWLEAHYGRVEEWNSAVSYFDAMSSLGSFRFLHSDSVFPEYDSSVIMEAEGMRHPLLGNNAVGNPCPCMRDGSFMVLTGANMSGKSTFLRTVGVAYLLALIGAPVLASGMRFSAAALFTSLNTADSLSHSESYFFAELKRLRRIAEGAENGDRMFVLLDEVLRGTNSADKRNGSIRFAEKLLGYDVAGIIATHDLELRVLSERYPEDVSLYCFEADIRGEELSFSYLLRPGLAVGLNACFLMRKMRIFD